MNCSEWPQSRQQYFTSLRVDSNSREEFVNVFVFSTWGIGLQDELDEPLENLIKNELE